MATDLGSFLDTNLVVDCFTTEPQHIKFDNFADGFKYKGLSIDDKVNKELTKLGTASLNILSKIIEDSIEDSSWDSLSENPKRREEILKRIESDIPKNSIVWKRNLKDIVLPLFSLFKEEYRDASEKQIIQFCRHNAKSLTDQQQMLLESRFNIYMSEKFVEEYSICLGELRSLNEKNTIFRITEEKEDKDFTIFCNLVIISVLGCYNNENPKLKIFFEQIKFYTRDPKFSNKIARFKEILEENQDTEIQKKLARALGSFEGIVPYEIKTS